MPDDANTAHSSRSTTTSVSATSIEYGVVGKSPGAYQPGTSLSSWLRRFEGFLELRKVPKQQKALVLLNEIGSVAYVALEDALKGAPPEDQTYEVLIEKLKKRFDKKKMEMAQRDKMLETKQREGQSLAEFFEVLQHLAISCNWGKGRELIIISLFIRGIRSEYIRADLLELEADENSESETFLEKAEKLEQSKIEAKSLGGRAPHPHNSILAIRKGHHKSSHRSFEGHPRRFGSKEATTLSCLVCGKKGHSKEKCFYKNEKCKNCGKVGHFAKLCRHRKSFVDRKSSNHHRRPRAHQVHFDDSDESSDRVLKIGKREVEPPIYVEAEIHKQKIKFELDTGSAISIIDKKTYKKLGSPEVEAVDYEPKAYNSSKITLLGAFEANVDVNGNGNVILIHVVEDCIGNICGRDMIRKLKMDCGPLVNLVCKNVQLKLEQILSENEEIFRDETGNCSTLQATLKLKEEATPKFCKARPVPYALKASIQEELQSKIDSGILKPIQHSDWATPIVAVKKANGKIRICGDFKVTVNPWLDINQYPLPKPEELFQALNGGVKFSKLDLKDAYLQISLDEESKKLVTINTHLGLLQYQRLPFGIASAPAIFQNIMEKILHGIEGVTIYLDDVTVTGQTESEHLERLAEVLKRLKGNGFRVKKEKCEFLKDSMIYLGHIIDASGIKTDPKKVEAIRKMPYPKNVKEIEAFMGMIQYYGKFIPNLSTLSAPLNALRRKDVKWEWSLKEKNAVDKIKEILVSAEVLAHYNPEIEIVLATDASEYGIGAVIYHRYPDNNERVIAYASRTLNSAERNYAQIEKEALGIVYGVEKFNQYLYGRKFVLLTDHQPLVKIFGPKTGIPTVAVKRLHRWALKLMIYTYDIEYRETAKFGNADGLSRLPNLEEKPSQEQLSLEHLVKQIQEENISKLPVTLTAIRNEIDKDQLLSKIRDYIKKGWPPKVKDEKLKPFHIKRHEMTLYQDCITRGDQIFIPQKFRKQILEILHESHTGIVRMKSLARTCIWYPEMNKQIEQIAKNCKECAIVGNEMQKVPLHLWEVPEKEWSVCTLISVGKFLDLCG